MAQRAVLLAAVLCAALHATVASRPINSGQARILFQAIAEDTAAVAYAELEQPIVSAPLVQQEVLSLEVPADAVPLAVTVAAVSGGETPPNCIGNAAYLQVRLFCQYTALATICTNTVDALVRADIRAINDNITLTPGSTRQKMCYLGMVDSVGASSLTTILTAKSTTPGLLLAYSWAINSVRGSIVFTATEQAAVEYAMSQKWLKKLMVWHAFNDPSIPSGVPLLNGKCSLWNATKRQYIHTEATSLAGAYPSVVAYPGAAAGFAAAWGYCNSTTVSGLGTAKTYAEAAISATVTGIQWSEVAAFSYCRPGGGHIFFSTVPADFVATKQSIAAWQNLRKFHPAALSAFTNDNPVCV